MNVFQKDYAYAYDHLYHDKDYEKECDFIETIFQKFTSEVKTVLDLGCGTGGHALILSSRGYKVTGIDRSEDMLKIAKKRAHDENLVNKREIKRTGLLEQGLIGQQVILIFP